jgi:drug/metabolite transporter (DMT)-like permease
MNARVALTLVLALGGAFLYALSNVLEQGEAEQIEDEHSLRPSLLVRLARRKRWLLGFAADAGGYVVSAAALAFGAIAFVQPLMAMGLLLSLLLGRAINHRPVRRGDWRAAVVLCCGLALFLYEVKPTGGLSVVTLDRWMIAGPTIVAAVALCIISARGVHGPPRAALLGTAAGIAFATSVLFTKAFVHFLGDGVFGWVPHWQTYAMVVAIVGGFLLIQSAFQAGSLAAAVGAVEATEPIASVAFGLGLLHERVFAASPAELLLVTISAGAVLWAIVALARAGDRAVEGVPLPPPAAFGGH